MEPEVTEAEGVGYPYSLHEWTKGPVSVELYIDDDAPDPRKEFDYWGEEDVKAWEDGEVFSFLLNYHDGEIDALSGLYGAKYAEEQALEALEQAWSRYVEESRRVGEWAAAMGRTMPGVMIPMEIPVGVDPAAWCASMGVAV